MESAMTEKYRNIFSRYHLKGMDLRNRMVMSPMGTFSDNRDGSFSPRMIEYYRARARGGVGLIIVEAQYVTNKTDPWIGYMTTAGTDEQMQSWALLGDAIHAEGAKMCIELGCGLGRNAFDFSGETMVSASAVPSFYDPDKLCRPLTVEEIHDIVDHYRIAGRNAIRAEVDAVEIHAHAGYLLDQFMTEIWNQRTDEYGGSFENRMRIVREIYEALRSEVGPDYPILLRMAADHDFPGGRTLEEGKKIARYLEDLGIDALDIDVGAYEHKQWIIPSIYAGDACMVDYAAEIRKTVDIPVLCAGTFTPDTAEEAVREGKCDLVMFGRQMIADPETPNKMREGRTEEIRPCLYCSEFCMGRLYQNRIVSCAVNAQAVWEKEYPLLQTDHPGKVAVVGGGVGGMEAARVAACCGHDVTLYERSETLGGQVLAAMQPPFKRRLKLYRDWQIRQLEVCGVKVVYNKEVSENSPELEEADHIIAAVGADLLTPPIPGIDGENVVNVLDAHLKPAMIKGRKVAVAGGGASGCDCALELAMNGYQVTIIEMAEKIGAKMLLDNRNPLLYKLEENQVRILENHKIVSITPEGLETIDREGGKVFVEADTIVSAFGTRPRRELADRIAEKYPTTAIVGDCNKIGQVGDAVRAGFFAAWGLH